MSDWHIRVLSAIARHARRRLVADRARRGEDPARAADRARELEHRSARADSQLAAAEARRRGAPADDA
jgi:hypothetical protein